MSIVESMDSVPSAPVRDAIPSMRVAAEKEPPAEPSGVDPCQTPLAHAIVPMSMLTEKEPTSRELLIDDRVERLLKENYLLLKERVELREAAQMRIASCNERLMEMRHAKKLLRDWMTAQDVYEADSTVANHAIADATWMALQAWAAKPI